MRKIVLALMLVSGLVATAQAGDWSTDGPPLPRLARLQNALAPPADATYSLGGYAPADASMNPNSNSGVIDKTELASPPGCCGGLWDGYQARPCHHRHHWGQGGCETCGGNCAYGLGGHGYGGHGWGGYGWGGHGWGGYGCGGCGLGGSACTAPACGCAAPCRQRHHCPLFGCHKRSNCGCDVATTCDGCGSAATDSIQPMPNDDGAPRPSPELLEPTPAPAPSPSAQRQPRIWRSMAAFGGQAN